MRAVGEQDLEDLTVPAATSNDLRVYARFGNVPVFQP
jgi:hypothetical protein